MVFPYQNAQQLHVIAMTVLWTPELNSNLEPGLESLGCGCKSLAIAISSLLVTSPYRASSFVFDLFPPFLPQGSSSHKKAYHLPRSWVSTHPLYPLYHKICKFSKCPNDNKQYLFKYMYSNIIEHPPCENKTGRFLLWYTRIFLVVPWNCVSEHQFC